MKKLSLIIFVLIFFQITVSAQTTEATNDEKAIVYIVRTSAIGKAINFKYFVDDKFVGKCKQGKYLILEIEPGEHLIWAKSENISFIEANLEAGNTYVINAEAKMGGLKARVNLAAIDNQDEDQLNKVKKYLSKKKLIEFDADELHDGQNEYSDLITDSLKKYEEEWKGKKEMDNLSEPTDMDKIIGTDK